MNQREAARSLQQATFRFNQLMNQQRKADAFNAKPESERNGLMAEGLTDKEKELLLQQLEDVVGEVADEKIQVDELTNEVEEVKQKVADGKK